MKNRYEIQRSRRHITADRFSEWYPVEDIRHSFLCKTEAIGVFEFWYRMFWKGMSMARAGYFFQTNSGKMLSHNALEGNKWNYGRLESGIEQWRLFDKKLNKVVRAKYEEYRTKRNFN